MASIQQLKKIQKQKKNKLKFKKAGQKILQNASKTLLKEIDFLQNGQEKIITKKVPKKTKNKISIVEEIVTNGEKKCINLEISDDLLVGSIEAGKEIFQRILSPIKVENFLNKYWEQIPCLIRKNNHKFFTNLISFNSIDDMLRNNHVEYTKNIDITSYQNGVRETLNPEGRALPSDVWNFYNDGCSVRLLNPQIFMPNIHKMNATLQEYFHCMVGINVYLTPPNSQGFAPHFDDIEAFVLQIEGKKRWKLYAPRTPEEQLPRYSSPNLDPNKIGKPILDTVIEAGDILYFPRGIIHQACTEPGYHSLHVTLSMYQKHSFADLFENLIPIALSNAIAKNVNLRAGLPLNIWKNLGVIHNNNNTKSIERDTIIKHCKELLKEIIEELPLDEAVDQISKKYQHDALPPVLSSNEISLTTFGKKVSADKNGKAAITHQINLNTQIRLLRANILRVVTEEDAIRVYYYVDNSVEYHEYDANFLEIEENNVAVICQLINSYPKYIKVSDISIDDEDKIEIIQYLWDRGLLMTKKPL